MDELGKAYDNLRKKGQKVKVNINFLMGILAGLKKEGDKGVELIVVNDKPLLINNMIVIAPIVEDY